MAEPIKIGPQVRARSAAEVGPSRFEQPVFERYDGFVIYRRCGECFALAIPGPQQSVLDQAVRTDQKLIAGEGRQRLIRRVAVPRRTQRQRLPPALGCLVETVDPSQRSWPDIANPVGRRQ